VLKLLNHYAVMFAYLWSLVACCKGLDLQFIQNSKFTF